nr:copia protein [Tanacetum cinerariifolium]
MTIIGTKWVFRNKLDENGIVSRNKARLVAQGYNQQEGIDYDETYDPVSKLESIRILLAYACALDFKLFQMDVKSELPNGFINEEDEALDKLKVFKTKVKLQQGSLIKRFWTDRGVDACPNACEMWKAIERLKQGESINDFQHLETNLFWEFGRFTLLDEESLESYYSRTHQAATRKREKAIVNSPQIIYDQEPSMVDDDEDLSKDKEIDKLMALISLSFKKVYKPTNNSLQTSGYEGQRSGTVAEARETVGSSMVQNSRIQCYNCKEYGHVARECQKPKRAKDAAYHQEKMLLCKQEEAGIQLNAEQAD